MTAWALNNLALAAIGSSLLAALALALRGIAGHDAALRHRVMIAFLAALLFLVPAQFLAAALAPDLAPDWARRAAEPLRIVVAPPSIETTLNPSSLPAAATAPVPPAPGGPAGATPGRWIPAMVLGLYGAGVLAGLALLLARISAARRLVEGAAPVTDRGVLAVWASVTEVSHQRTVRLLESAALAVPSAWGLSRPAVILPADEGAPGGHALECALRHELTHLDRADALVNLAQHLAVAVFWFNPLVHVFARRLDDDRETSCDAHVARVTGARPYALALLRCCPGTGRRGAQLLAPFWSPANLERRLHMLEHALDRTSPRRARFVTGAACACLAAVLAAGGAAAIAVAPPRDASAQPENQPKTGDAIVVRKLKERAGLTVEAEIRPVVPVRNRALLLRTIQEQNGGRMPDSVTEQETAASFQETGKVGAKLKVRDLNLNLPEGSPLRAVFDGESVRTEVTAGQTQLTVQGGSVRLLDDGDVARVTVRPAEPGLTLVWTAARANDEVNFTVCAAGGAETEIIIELELEKGIPKGEKQPPHGSVRWALLPGSAAEKRPTRVKIQWILDIATLQRETGGAK